MLADGAPLQPATSYIPWAIANGSAIVETDSGPGGIYARIEELGHELASFQEDMTARLASHSEAEELNVDTATPVVQLTRVAYDTTGRPVEVCDCVMVASRFRLRYRFPQT